MSTETWDTETAYEEATLTVTPARFVVGEDGTALAFEADAESGQVSVWIRHHETGRDLWFWLLPGELAALRDWLAVLPLGDGA